MQVGRQARWMRTQRREGYVQARERVSATKVRRGRRGKIKIATYGKTLPIHM
jgi:hypothetical protein